MDRSAAIQPSGGQRILSQGLKGLPMILLFKNAFTTPNFEKPFTQNYRWRRELSPFTHFIKSLYNSKDRSVPKISDYRITKEGGSASLDPPYMKNIDFRSLARFQNGRGYIRHKKPSRFRD